MTEEQLSLIEADPDIEPATWQAQFIVEAWESRFPDVLTESGRFLLFNFIRDGFKAQLSKKA